MKFVKKLLLVFVMLFMVTGFVACSENNKIDPEESVVVNFNTQGGSQISPVTVKLSEVATFKLPQDPTKEGYAFVGWYLDSAYGTAFVKLEAKAGEVTLYAKWDEVSKNSIVVKFVTNGGTPLDNVVLSVEDLNFAALLKTPTKEGETFIGWFTDAALTKAVNVDDIVKALSSKEITLYAKWGKESEVTSAGIQISTVIEGELDVDLTEPAKQKLNEDGTVPSEDTPQFENNKGNAKAKLTIDLAVATKSVEKFEDYGLALVVGATVNAKANDEEEFSLTNVQIKLYLKDGVLYAFLPQELLDTEDDIAVKLDLVKVYNDNIDTVKEKISEGIEMLKTIPADELPEGFDFSFLNDIDVDNLTLEDLMGIVENLKALLPEEYKGMIENPEELTIDGIFALLQENLLSQYGISLSEKDYEYIEKALTELLGVLAGLLPTKTENGNTTKYEITDKQVKDTIDNLGTFAKENINDIFELVVKIQTQLNGEEYVEPEEPTDISAFVGPMVDGYTGLAKDSFTINNAYFQYTTNGLFPSNVKALLDVSVDFDSDKYEALGIEPGIKLKASAKLSLDVNVALIQTGIEYPSFADYQMDVTDTVSYLVDSFLNNGFGDDNTISETSTPEDVKDALEELGYMVNWSPAEEGEDGEETPEGLVGTVAAMKSMTDLDGLFVGLYFETSDDAQAYCEVLAKEQEMTMGFVVLGQWIFIGSESTLSELIG